MGKGFAGVKRFPAPPGCGRSFPQLLHKLHRALKRDKPAIPFFIGLSIKTGLMIVQKSAELCGTAGPELNDVGIAVRIILI